MSTGEKIPQFQPAGRQRQLAKAENWFSNHSPTLTGVVVPVTVGVTIGFFGTLFSAKYLAELTPKMKSFLSAYLPASNPQPQRDSKEALLDYSGDVMRRMPGV